MGEVYISNHPLIQHKLSILRDVKTKPCEYRMLVKELGTLLCYEATRDLELQPKKIRTPQTEMTAMEISEEIALFPILRAGLGLADSFVNLIPNSKVYHIGIYRNKETLEPVIYYYKFSNYPPSNRCLVLDPALSTGGTAIAAIDILKKWGAKKIKFVGLAGAPQGIKALQEAHPDVDIYLAAVDDHLNEIGYLVPGLGDAGDRQFGTL